MYWYHNALLLLYRPSLSSAVPQPEALQYCYTAAIAVIQISFVRHTENTMDISWIVVHHQFIAGITLLFTIWNSATVKEKAIAEWTTVKSCLAQCEVVLTGLGKRWQSVKGAREILQRLATITIDLLEKEMMGSDRRTRGAVTNAWDNALQPSTTIRAPSQPAWSPEAPSYETATFQSLLEEDLSRNLWASPSILYNFDTYQDFDTVDWSQTASVLNFHDDQEDIS